MLALATGLVAEEPKELLVAKKDFAQNAHPDEATREHYVRSLAAIREKLARSNGNWQAVDGELKRHPAPKEADAKVLTAYRLGRWDTTRHQLLFRKDGTWTMLPAEPGATQGTWRMEGNQYIDRFGDEKTEHKYTIILLTAKEFIYTDGEMVFFEKKGK